MIHAKGVEKDVDMVVGVHGARVAGAVHARPAKQELLIEGRHAHVLILGEAQTDEQVADRT